MIGYSTPDYGMDEYFAGEEMQQAQESHQQQLIETHKEECREIAKRIAPLYYACNGNNYYESAAHFIEECNDESWHGWLIEEASMCDWSEDEDLTYAMRLICNQEGEDFANVEWVLTQIEKHRKAA